MKDKDLTWDKVNSNFNGKPLFDRYCGYISSCDVCNPKIRFWCEIKSKIHDYQTEIIKKTLDKRSDNNGQKPNR